MTLVRCARCHRGRQGEIGESCPACGAPLSVHDDVSNDVRYGVFEATSRNDETPGECSSAPGEVNAEPSGTESHDLYAMAGPCEPDSDSGVASTAGEYPFLSCELTESPDESPTTRGVLSLLFSPRGRIGRLAFVIGNSLVSCAVAMSMLFSVSTDPLTSEEPSLSYVVLLCVAILGVYMISLKRVHDFDVSGGALFLFTLCLGVIPLLFFAFLSGSQGRNRYGRASRLRWNVISSVAAITLGLGGTYAAVVLTQLTAVEKAYGKAFAAYEDGRLDEATHQFQNVFDAAKFGHSLCPVCGNFAAHEMFAAWLRGEILSSQNEWESAVDWLNRAARAAERLRGSICLPDIESNVWEIRLALVVALRESGESVQAVALLEEVPQEVERALHALGTDLAATEGSLRLDLEEYDKAKEIYARLIEHDKAKLSKDSTNENVRSDLAGYYHNRGLARSNLGDINGALADLREAIQLQETAIDSSPESREFSVLLGNHLSLVGALYQEMGDEERALEALQEPAPNTPVGVSRP